jgi:NADH:ubiquinone oxidoreductase subunit 5 (subunit L)/multisubunit Na+/H+ antiporter MnhA subunit
MSKIISTIKWVLGTIVLGALGSGLWELFISDLFNWLGLASLELATNLFTDSKDKLYERVSDGAVVSYLKLPATLITFILAILLPIIFLSNYIIEYLINSFNEGEEEHEEKYKEQYKSSGNLTFRKYLIALMSIAVVLYALLAFRYLYTANAANFVEKSVDILAPHISENKKLALIAEYRSIKNSEDYEAIFSKLKDLEKEHGIELPEFEPI